MPGQLPPLNAIRAFDAAARHLNFSRAAEELGVTQGAISKQVIALEDFIGARLFERLPGGLSLTQEGYSLKSSIAPAFAMLDEAFARYHRRPPRSNVCRVSTVASFASKFLVPRLSKFEADLPHIKLEILTSDRIVDLSREEVDFSVRYGPGHKDGAVNKQLAPGKLAAVCAPCLFDGESDKDLSGFLEKARCIQMFSNNEWRKWSEASGVALPQGKSMFIIEDFIVTIEAVLAGQGAALIPEILVRDYLRKGEMREFSRIRVDWNQAHYIAYLAGSEKRAAVREVIDWLCNEVAASVIAPAEA
jgi:LysR family transcriptional regulator, glycine cleavage system transcriptional activator